MNESAPCNSYTGYKFIVIMVCVTAALGGLLFGLDQGFIANSLSTIQKVYDLGTSGGESYSAILATGGVIGALLSGFFARLLGRKKSLVFAGFIFVAMSVISALLPPLRVLFACRFGLGFAVGVASFIVPLYLSETAPSSIRGSMGTLFQFMITIGIFLISLTNVLIVKVFLKAESALPFMFLVIALFALLMFIGSVFLPESPRWLMLKKRRKEAVKVLRRTLNTQQEVDFEISEIEAVVGDSRERSLGVVFNRHFIKILIVGILLQVFQQLVGINLMVYYAPTIFSYVGMNGFIAKMAVPTVFMVFTIPAIWLVEKWGRKKLLYIGAGIMGVAMICSGVAFLMIGKVTDPALISSTPKVLLLAAAAVYMFGFAFSWGPVVWLVCSEIFPMKGREIGMTLTTMVNWTFAGLVMGNALTVMRHYGNFSIFFIFGVFCILAIIFLSLYVPETKGITLEELEFNLNSGKRLKDLGQWNAKTQA
ncbi:sugar porter family MFS transporter [Lentisphaerota bacterium ZTH]|nr:sugar porter family MFS transporter [Lentisphaerota bacterium]WET07306.1 sugar porter family MFS transporter [Lentisphaerota bacterium ZTH]